MVDMYSSSGDPDLASLSGTTKQIQMDAHYNAPKEWFHPETRQTLCSQALVDKQIDRQDCIQARDYCQKIM